jgi:murein L,D-transpeptidase YcbB/YkuD
MKAKGDQMQIPHRSFRFKFTLPLFVTAGVLMPLTSLISTLSSHRGLRQPATALALVLVVGIPPGPALAEVAAVATRISAQAGLVKAPLAGQAFRQALAEAAADDEALSTFYRGHDYAPLWTSALDAGRREAFFRALDHAADHALPVARYEVDGLREAFASVTSERARGRLEVRMSRLLLRYVADLQTGILTPAKVDPGIVREVPLRDRLAQITTFSVSDPSRFFRSVVPDAPQYGQLMKERLDLLQVIGRGGWGPEVAAQKLQPGDSGPAVIALRDRLVAMGYLRRTASAGFDGAMQKAVQLFQIDHGLAADGIAGEGTIAEVNVAPDARLASVVVAMERLRWLNGLDLGKRHIWVNLPDFTARIVDDGKVTFETVTVIGMDQGDRRSPEFSDEMELMVVNPTWSVPRSITVKEYLPLLKKNPNAAGHLKIVDRKGRAVNRGAVDFSQYTERNFPYSMSQPPSDGNALGKVKFLFPNKWNIYLHDTPSKSLFDREVRAFSHGCIRVGRPFDLAYALLAPQTDDPEGLFQKYLKSGAETPVRLETPVPVHIVYFTAWPNARGRMEYRRDVYGRDRHILEALIAAGVEPERVRG